MGYKDLIDRVFGEQTTISPKVSDSYKFSEAVFIQDVMTTLTEREALVLFKRHSFNNYEFRTLRALGVDIGVTQERVRQIEAKALRKLKHPARSTPIRRNIRMAQWIEERELAAKTLKLQEEAKRAQEAKERYVPLDELDISVRTRNCLFNENITNLTELILKSERDMLRIPNFGRKSLRELGVILAEYNLTFAK